MAELQLNKGVEKERQLQEIFEALVKNRGQEASERTMHPDEWLSERIESLPTRAREDVLAYEKGLEEDGVTDPEKRMQYVESKISAFEQTYQDFRFSVGKDEHMLKKEYAKEQAVDWLNEALGEKPGLEDLRKVALLNFDANGLKAVNDLSGSHEKGTEYLRRIAEIFHDQSSPEAAWLKNQGVKDILPVTAGGDEYSVMIRADAPIDAKVVGQAVRMYEDAISRIDISDLVDFSREEAKLRFLGVSETLFEQMGETERAELLSGFDKEMPAGFKMRASASGGGTTLYEGLLRAVEHATKPILASDSFDRSVQKIMGGTWDAADKAAMETKIVYKEYLRTDNDDENDQRSESAKESDKFYSKVLARTSEARVLESKIEGMAKEIREARTMESELADLDKLLDEGSIDDASYGKNMRLIRKKYRPGE